MTKNINVLQSVKDRLDKMSSEFCDFNQCLFTDEVRTNIENGLIRYWLTPFKIDFDSYEFYYEEEDRRDVDIDSFFIDLRRELIEKWFPVEKVDMFGAELSDYIYSITCI